MGKSKTAALTGDIASDKMGTDNIPIVGSPPLERPINKAPMADKIKRWSSSNKMSCRFVKNKAHTPCHTQRPHNRQGGEPQAFGFISNGCNSRHTRCVDQHKQHKAVGLYPIEVASDGVNQHLSFLSVNHSQ